MSGLFPAKTLAEMGCSYTMQGDSLSLVGENGLKPAICIKVGKAAIIFPLDMQTINGLRLALSKL